LHAATALFGAQEHHEIPDIVAKLGLFSSGQALTWGLSPLDAVRNLTHGSSFSMRCF